MSVPVPLGVRIYSYGRISMDRWVTPWVSDLSFRSVIPGGFASATIKMVRPRMMQTPEVVTGTATAAADSSTPDYLVCGDADAAGINIGDRVWIYDSGGDIRYGGARFRITAKPSAFGFTNLTFTPDAPGVTNTGDVMKAAAPGHFAYADPVVFDELTSLFNRVQIVDLRTMEIVWEGRIEDPQRDSDDDSWTLGCLGSMIVTSDIQRPMFYIDASLDSWQEYHSPASGYFSVSKLGGSNTIRISFDWGGTGGYTTTGALAIWDKCRLCDIYLGRFDITYGGAGGYSSLGIIQTSTNVGAETGVDLTAWNSADVRKANAVGGGSSFTSTTAQEITLNVADFDAISDPRGTETAYGYAYNPRVQAQRVNRSGTRLTSSTDYPNDYVTVPQVVEDVVGRFLRSDWYIGADNTPYPGQIRDGDIFIDTSSTAQITNLTFYDGATAADVLGELMKVQTSAYWAIWESNFEATDGAGGINDYGFRFEWAKWPNGWGYQITSADGLSEQPNGEDAYNFLFYTYVDSDSAGTYEADRCQTFWDGDNNAHLAGALITRATVIHRDGLIDGTTAFSEAGSRIADLGKSQNSGTVTVKRPIHLYDTGSTSNSGASRMLDPWQIRPGKLARITDMVVQAKAHDFSHGNTAPPIELDGTVFKVVATEYNAGENACTLELDQVTTWRTETQIASSAQKKPTLVVKG